MTKEELFIYIKKLYKQNQLPFTVQYFDISTGDRYYNEQGEDFHFKLLGKSYKVGYSYITEDADDWAQAECYKVDWSDCDGKDIKADFIHQLIENYQSENRDDLINNIIQ
jgi:hypothetical protein